MNQNAKAKMQAKIEKKKEIEHLNNKSLIIFTVALLFEVILMFIYSAYKANGGVTVEPILGWLSLILIVAFLVLFILSKKFAKDKNKEEKAKHMKNWSYVLLTSGVLSFVISIEKVVTTILNLFGANDAAMNFSANVIKFTGKTSVTVIMCALAVYVIASFIYYNVKISKIKKSK